jgi:amino acid transporter
LTEISLQAGAIAAREPPRLRRVLSLWDLILYGIVLIMPIAAVPLFGIVQRLSLGHAVTTIVNLRGIRTNARINLVLCALMCGVVMWFIGVAVRFLFAHQGWHGLISSQPFYNPATFHLSSIATATAVAALTYGGFDGVTTLAEEVKNPRRNVLLATVLVCLFTGLFGGLQIYLAQRVWPDYSTFPNLETAFIDVSRVVGGAALFHAMAGILIVANLGAGLSAQAGVSRLLFGMGRDSVLPRRAFTYLDPKRNTPTFNLWLVGILAFLGSLVLNYERAAELINFGAFLAFMGVNAATMRQFYFVKAEGRTRRFFQDALVPAAGFVFCLIIWLNLATPAKIAGAVWFVVGVSYDAILTRGFRVNPVSVDFTES